MMKRWAFSGMALDFERTGKYFFSDEFLLWAMPKF